MSPENKRPTIKLRRLPQANVLEAERMISGYRHHLQQLLRQVEGIRLERLRKKLKNSNDAKSGDVN